MSSYSSRTPVQDHSAFTLVEILIVVTIIGILAAIVIPPIIGTAQQDSGEVALRMSLGTIRQAIQSYALGHQGRFPGSASDGTNPPGTASSFTRQLALPTNSNGTVLDDVHVPQARGPYIHGSIPPCPVGPLTGNSDINFVTGYTKLMPDAQPRQGWKFNISTGEFICNTTALSSGGTPYWTW
jgi:prepilin-type N-terminal cleavage/methylation domain-containing protein